MGWGATAESKASLNDEGGKFTLAEFGQLFRLAVGVTEGDLVVIRIKADVGAADIIRDDQIATLALEFRLGVLNEVLRLRSESHEKASIAEDGAH